MATNPAQPRIERFTGTPERLLIVGLFVGSGAAALIYEVVWLQMLQLVIGLTSISLGILLGTFMGGMCLGSLLLPRWISNRHHPLRIYALLEVAIAITGVILLFALPAITELYTIAGGRGTTGILIRGLVAALCLLVPTFLMGATLPAVAKWVESTRDGMAWLGLFYGGNILGAVAGCLIAGFYLLRVHDSTIATYAAGTLNLIVAAAAWVLAARRPQPSAPESPGVDEEAPSTQTEPATLMPSWVIYLTAGFSGASALGAEVVWTRLLSLLLGGTVYTFSIILAVFLVGLGLGSTWGSWLARTSTRPQIALWLCQLTLAGAVAWAAFVISGSLPYWPINPTLSQDPWHGFQLDIVRCLWAILPAAILWGASFPLALAALHGRGTSAGDLVSRLYAANTLGAIVGALAFSLFIVPRAGSHAAQQALIWMCGFSALLAALPIRSKASTATSSEHRLRSQPIQGWIRPALSLVVAAICSGWVIPAPWGLAAYGRFMATYNGRLAPGIVKEHEIPTAPASPDIFCLYAGEGLNGTVAVTQWTSGVRNFHSAGKVQASSDPRDMRLQRMLGHLSALLHQKPESVLVVACGAGVTAGAFVPHPEVKRIVICDIEPLVPTKVAPMFEKENHRVLKDPRTEVIFDDGRHFIRTAKERFDIITSDPIDPWVKGCAALNTIEYFEMCKARLNPGGVMSLWIPLYETDLATVKSSISTFFKVFPNGVLWANDTEEGGYDAVLLGTAEPMQVNLEAFQKRLTRPDHAAVQISLKEAGFPSGLHLLGTYAGRAVDLGDWMRDAQVNTDRNLRLQYLAGWSLNSFMGPGIMNDITRHRVFPRDLFLGSDAHLQVLRSMFQGWKFEPAETSNPAK